MRLRKRAGQKVIIISLVSCALFLVCILYFADYQKERFIIHLPATGDGDSKQSLQADINLESATNYTIRNDICQKTDKEILGIIVITSYVGHDELRAAHRAAISQSKLAEMGFQRVFLLGQIPSKERFIQQQQLLAEQQRFGDLLQGNFLEAYRNLSYKNIMGLGWAASQCGRAKFVIKLDDDIVFDVFQLRRYLETLEVEQPSLVNSSAYLAGYLMSKTVPKRLEANKWYVTQEEFAASMYPNYVAGWMYIATVPTVRRLVAESRRGPVFWIDDIWITGILRERLQIPISQLDSWFSINSQFLECCVRDLKQSNYECEFYVGPNGGDSKLLVEFLHNVEKCYFDECVKRPANKSLRKTCVAEAQRHLPEHGDAQIQEIKLK